jgi:hypothetical protein
MVTLVRISLRLIEDALRWVVLLVRSTESVHAENLFLRRQLALYIERDVRPQRVDAATRISSRSSCGIGGRPARDFIRLNSLQPARCQRQTAMAAPSAHGLGQIAVMRASASSSWRRKND